MTDPDDKPSFLARLAFVVTIVVLALQIFGGIVARSNINWPNSYDYKLGVFLVSFFPLLAHSAFACIYYLFKGQPMNADSVVKSLLFRVWTLSYIFGIVFLNLI